jgi:hypothetical protein
VGGKPICSACNALRGKKVCLLKHLNNNLHNLLQLPTTDVYGTHLSFKEESNHQSTDPNENCAVNKQCINLRDIGNFDPC